MKKIEYLKKMRIFGGLSLEELRALNTSAKIVRFKNRARIIAENAPEKEVFTIISGKVLIYRISPEGKIRTLAVLSSGDFFGEMAIISPAPRSASARALGRVEVLKIDAAAFRKVLTENREVSFATLNTLCHRLRKADRHIEILSYQSVPMRVVNMLLNLVNHRGGGAARTSVALTQQELAEMIASAREVVNRTLQVLKKEGLLELNKGRIIVTDTKKLGKYKFGG